uniref:Uncharacterized protein n=1 Tax=Chrysotila carterae TaxID=13221 RepID=A0A7S4BH85_CHRCT
MYAACNSTPWERFRCQGCVPLPAASSDYRVELPRFLLERQQPARGSSRPTVTFVSYASGEPFVTSQRRFAETAKMAGADRVELWDRERVSATEWGRQHMQAVPRSPTAPGCKTCAWKPFIILEELKRLREGDFVIYADSSRYYQRGFARPFTPLLARLSNASSSESRATGGIIPGLRLRQRNNARINWRTAPKKRPFSDSPLTRCDLCDLLTHTGLCPRVVPAAQDVSAPDGRGRRRRGRGARAAATTGQGTVDEACCDVFLHAPHVQNSFSVWQKSALAVRFVEQWLRFNEDEEVTKRSRYGDQSIVTLLATHYSINLGLRLPYLPATKSPSCAELGVSRPFCPARATPYYSLLVRHPDALFGAFDPTPPRDAWQPRPLFLLASHDYPECVSPVDGRMHAEAQRSAERAGVMCRPLSPDPTIASPRIAPITPKPMR